MRNFILFSLFTACVLSAAVRELTTLNDTHRLLKMALLFQRDEEGLKIFKNTDDDCLKNALKLDQIGDKSIDDDFGNFVFASAAIFCTVESEENFDFLLDKASAGVEASQNIECYKKRLQEIHPDSYLLSGYTPDASVKCNQPVISNEDIQEKLIIRKKEVDAYGIGNCMNITVKDVEIYLLDEIIAENLQAVRKSISQNFIKDFFKEIKKDDEKILKCSTGVIASL